MPEASTIITPSILSADFAHLQDEVDSIATADWIQIDVMDGHFVPALSFGVSVMKTIKTKLPLDVHLMVENPADRIQECADLHVKNITFHAEAVQSRQARKELIAQIRATGATAGIAINPETPLDKIGDIIADIDLLLVMSVHPGFAGQVFIEHVLSQVRTARLAYPNLMIQMDGGINATTAAKCREAGANNLVSGSFIFKEKDRILAIESLRHSV